MTDFVRRGSIVRRIWGDGDMVLLVFAGSAAEFALNRAVDWLFFTGKLPNDPIGRLFPTAGYAQHIVFADQAAASATLGRIRAVHQAVERQRGQANGDKPNISTNRHLPLSGARADETSPSERAPVL